MCAVPAALVANHDMTAGLIHVRDGTEEWSDAVGVRDLRSGAPAAPTGHFRTGSVTKTPAVAPDPCPDGPKPVWDTPGPVPEPVRTEATRLGSAEHGGDGVLRLTYSSTI
jgi:hypothetical protein